MLSACARKTRSNPELEKTDGVQVLVHGRVVVGPLVAPSKLRAKGLAAEQARAILQDANSALYLKHICECMLVDSDAQARERVKATELSEGEMNDETEEGFALRGQVLLDELERDEEAVEAMLNVEESEDYEEPET